MLTEVDITSRLSMFL